MLVDKSDEHCSLRSRGTHRGPRGLMEIRRACRGPWALTGVNRSVWELTEAHKGMQGLRGTHRGPRGLMEGQGGLQDPTGPRRGQLEHAWAHTDSQCHTGSHGDSRGPCRVSQGLQCLAQSPV